jgi:hypothetical protein
MKSEEDNEDNEEINLNKLSHSLIKYLSNDSLINQNIKSNWVPPTENGLNNSPVIIPEYYFINKENIFNIDYYNIIIDDIRNYRKLNEYQLEYIKKLNHEYKFNVILEFNKLFNVIYDLM